MRPGAGLRLVLQVWAASVGALALIGLGQLASGSLVGGVMLTLAFFVGLAWFGFVPKVGYSFAMLGQDFMATVEQHRHRDLQAERVAVLLEVFPVALSWVLRESVSDVLHRIREHGPDGATGYVVRVACASEQIDARRLAAELAKQGLTLIKVTVEDEPRGGCCRVRVQLLPEQREIRNVD